MQTAHFDSNALTDDGWQVALSDCVSVHVATRLDEVEGVIDRADRAAHGGHWAAVAVSYEAAAAFEPALAPPRAVVPGLPLAWVAIFARGTTRTRPVGSCDEPAHRTPPSFTPTVSRSQFTARVRDAGGHILAGDTYQVNLTFPMRADTAPDPSHWYDGLRAAQQARYCAYLDLGRQVVLSLSPELFFARRGQRLTARPMKGTIRRGRWLAEDEALARELVTSPKARAENVMIADLLRNDIGRVAITGSVHNWHAHTNSRSEQTVGRNRRSGPRNGDVTPFVAWTPQCHAGRYAGAARVPTAGQTRRVRDDENDVDELSCSTSSALRREATKIVVNDTAPVEGRSRARTRDPSSCSRREQHDRSRSRASPRVQRDDPRAAARHVAPSRASVPGAPHREELHPALHGVVRAPGGAAGPAPVEADGDDRGDAAAR